MRFIATEFPIKPLPDRAAFIAQMVAWLSGNPNSTILNGEANGDLTADNAHLTAASGEELRVREFAPNGPVEAIGFRHDIPDAEGRLWRTEAVLRKSASIYNQDLIRFRTQCIAREIGARLDAPRKPYLIKSILNDESGGEDGVIPMSDGPHWLQDTPDSLEIARDMTRGVASYHLPVIYVSAIGTSKWLLTPRQIERLAFDLGGIAHVLVEPNRAFSLRLRDITSAANPYGGTLAISVPGRGTIRKFYRGGRIVETEELLFAMRASAFEIRSSMPSQGWDWTELQEQALRHQRERDKKRLNDQETEQLYLLEIDNLKDRIAQLDDQIASRATERSTTNDEGLLPPSLAEKLGPEIYLGEYSDRLRFAAQELTKRAEQIGLDDRTVYFLTKIGENLPTAPALSALLSELKRSTRDGKRMADEVTRLLSRHGYREKSDNKHIKLEPKEGYGGLGSIVLPKTPSDGRGLANMRKDIERTLGVSRLSE